MSEKSSVMKKYYKYCQKPIVKLFTISKNNLKRFKKRKEKYCHMKHNAEQTYLALGYILKVCKNLSFHLDRIIHKQLKLS